MHDSVPGTDLLNPEFSLPPDLFEDDDVARYRYDSEPHGRSLQGDGADESQSAPRSRRFRCRRREGSSPRRATWPRSIPGWTAATSSLDETLAAAWHPAADRNGIPSPMGLGWFVQNYRNERVVWHFGFVPNAYSSLILKLPDEAHVHPAGQQRWTQRTVPAPGRRRDPLRFRGAVPSADHLPPDVRRLRAVAACGLVFLAVPRRRQPNGTSPRRRHNVRGQHDAGGPRERHRRGPSGLGHLRNVARRRASSAWKGWPR